MSDDAPKRTALYDEHVKLGARMVPFAGYDMPVQYPTGIIAEHNWTRENAGLFDVSHMGQCFVVGPDFEASAKAMERIVPADILGLKPNQQRYSQLLSEDGGTLDDLMITRSSYAGHEGWLYVVVNAGRKDHDYQWIAKHLPEDVSFKPGENMSLVALQGRRRKRCWRGSLRLCAVFPSCTTRRSRSAASGPMSRARATRARTASKSRCLIPTS